MTVYSGKGKQIMHSHARVLFLLALSCAGSVLAATPIPVAAPQSNEPPTFTLLYEVEDPQITLVTILGGEGRVGINESSTDTRNQTTQMVKNLTRKDFTNLRVNVVVFDSPTELYPPAIRSGANHLDRIVSVVQFYKAKFNVPVWLLGHSNGSISVTEYLKKKLATAAVSAAVLSGSVYSIELNDSMAIPLLFLHHEDDQCRNTPFRYAMSHFEEATKLNKAATELLMVKGGESRGDPCRDGKHMYYGAYDEAARQLAVFIGRVIAKQ
jgi:hypothetical protein